MKSHKKTKQILHPHEISWMKSIKNILKKTKKLCKYDFCTLAYDLKASGNALIVG